MVSCIKLMETPGLSVSTSTLSADLLLDSVASVAPEHPIR
jgi:hypothetical protein